MAQQNITIGSADAGGGDNPFAAWTKAEANFTELYGLAGKGLLETIPITITGAGAVITTGAKAFYVAQYAFSIAGWTLLAGPGETGSIVIDVWKRAYANFPPTVAQTMIATGTKPTITAAQKGQSLTPNWAVLTVAAGDVLAFNVDSVTTLTMAQLFLHILKT